MKIKPDLESVDFVRLATVAALSCGVSSLALMHSAPAMAQEDGADAAEDDEEDGDTIVVQGIRRSLQNAQDIKRDADTFVDAVTAEDIGALPDRSVTEALQRVPGVSISRFAAADDPDHFSIEGSGVIVRGLTFVRSELNGRDTFSANSGRALSFADVPPELLGSVQVFKNQTAELIEGGVAGTVNLVTRKPFDSNDRVIAGSLEYNYTDFREEWAPTVSGLFSDRWETDAGEFGLLINGVTSELKSRSDGTQISAFRPRTDIGPGTEIYVPEGAAIRTQNYDRERTGFGGSLQWQNPDRTMVATAEFLRSEATTSWNEHATEIATDNVTAAGGSFFVPGTEYEVDNDGLLTRGIISAPIGWRQDQNSDDPRTPIYGGQSNNIARGVEQEYVTTDYSANLKWTPNDRWSMNFDYQFVDSTVSNIDATIWGSTFQDTYFNTQNDIPDIVFLTPNELGPNPPDTAYQCAGGPGANCPTYMDAPNDSFEDPYNSFWRSAMDHLEDSEGTENAFRFDAEYDFLDDHDWIRSVRFGGRWTERDQTTRFSTYNWGSLSEIWGGGGPIWMDEVGGPEGVIENFDWNDFQRGEVTAPPAYPFYAGNPAKDYDDLVAFADSVAAAWTANGGGPSWASACDRPGVVDGTCYLPGEINETLEKTNAFYAQINFGHDDPFGNGMTIDGNFGFRYVTTDFESAGAYQFPDFADLTIDEGLPAPDGENACLTPTDLEEGQTYEAPGFCALSEAERNAAKAFSNSAGASSLSNHTYKNFLPSFNMKIGLTEDMLVRLGYSKAMSRPDLGLMRNYFTLSPSQGDVDPRTQMQVTPPAGYGSTFFGFIGSGGNPTLDPVTSDQFDASFEWYFADVGSLTVSAFYKELHDIIVTGQGSLSFTNNGVTYDDVFVRQPTNSDETGKIRGLEFAYQQFYDFLPEPLDGFGIQASYTFIDSDGVQSSGVSNTSTTPGGTDDNQALVDLSNFPLQGLSEHNTNFAAIYEKGPISTRLAYSWRSEYLVTPRDVITPYYPVFQNASGQLDGSFFYTINDNFKVGVQGANLLNEITETTMLIPESGDLELKGGRSWFQNDRRVTVSLRANF